MPRVVYRGLTNKDLDRLIVAAIDDFDLWGGYDSSKDETTETNSHIQRVDTAREQILEEEK